MSGSHPRRWCNRSWGQSKPSRPSPPPPQLNQKKEQCQDQHRHHHHHHHHHRHYHQYRSPRLQQSQRLPKSVLIHGRPLDWAPPLPSTWSLDRRRRSKQHHLHHHHDLQLEKCLPLLQWRLVFSRGLQQTRRIEILIWRTTCSSEEQLHSRRKSLFELQSNPGQQQQKWNDYRRRKRRRKRNMKIRPRSLRLQVMWPSTIGTEQAPAALVKRQLNAERRSSFHRRDHHQRDLHRKDLHRKDHHQKDHPQKGHPQKGPHSENLHQRNPLQKDRHQQQQQRQQHNKKPHLKEYFYHQKEFHQKV